MLYFYILIVLQIVVESLPISSSSHVHLLELGVCQVPLSSSVIYALHIPTALVLALYFFKRWFFMLAHLRACAPIVGRLFLLGTLVDGITALFFVFVHKLHVDIPLGVGLCITALALYSLRLCVAGNTRWGYFQAIILGIA